MKHFRKKVKPLPTVARLRELFRYDAQTGDLYWWPRCVNGVQRNSRWTKEPAGTKSEKGYLLVHVDGQCYLVHRVIYKMFTGLEPDEVDHKDRNKSNNRFENLRASDKSRNTINRNLRPDNTSGVTGVSFNRKRGRWDAYLNINGKRVWRGQFDDFQDALDNRLEAERRFHGEFSPRRNAA